MADQKRLTYNDILAAVTGSKTAIEDVVAAFNTFYDHIQQPHIDSAPTPVPAQSSGSVVSPRLHVVGAKLMDGQGNEVWLRGGQIESSLIYEKAWDNGESPTKVLNEAAFAAMRAWHMNVVRIPISNWIYSKDTAKYLSVLDTVVTQANKAGLYVIPDLHDNGQSGSPYQDGAIPKQESLDFWKDVATHYKDNHMLIFDIFNEPADIIGWDMWAQGTGNTSTDFKAVGHQTIVEAIRATGAKQPLIVEPGSAGGRGTAWTNVGNVRITGDSSIIYSQHVYQGIKEDASHQDARWGTLLHQYPLIYGEWAFLPNARIKAHCEGITAAQAPILVQNFLQYMQGIKAHWVAWQFGVPHLVKNTTDFAPTSLNVPWTCGDITVVAGMGELVKAYLAQ